MDSHLPGELTLAETRTESLCPVCLERIPAYRETRGEDVYLVKRCKDHGAFEALVWQSPPDFESWKRPKIPTTPPVTHTAVDRGCPFDCGLCPDHRQRSCAVLIEVHEAMRSRVRVLLRGFEKRRNIRSVLGNRQRLVPFGEKHGRAGFNIQLSGGEPTMRDDLPDIVALGRSFGFDFIQLNTNGVRLARDRDYVKALKDAGLSSVFLQFDGTDDAIYRKMRGRDLLAEKIGAVEACGDVGLGVVLVPTVVSGVNDENVGEILKTAIERAPGGASRPFSARELLRPLSVWVRQDAGKCERKGAGQQKTADAALADAGDRDPIRRDVSGFGLQTARLRKRPCARSTEAF